MVGGCRKFSGSRFNRISFTSFLKFIPGFWTCIREAKLPKDSMSPGSCVRYVLKIGYYSWGTEMLPEKVVSEAAA